MLESRLISLSRMSALPSVLSEPPAISVAGKALRAGAERWHLSGVAYGPFRPNMRGEPFPEDAVMLADLDRIVRLGFNTLRLYQSPSEALLAAAEARGLRLLVGLAWTDHVDFLRTRQQRQQVVERVRAEAARLAHRPVVAAFLVGNELEKTLVRWLRPARVRDFLERLIEAGRSAAPERLFSYASYPSTEYLIPRNADFLALNVYLEDPVALRAYALRLQNLAGNKPLVITEHGLDAGLHGEAAQAAALVAQRAALAAASVAGEVWFSYTDEWFRGGEEVRGWSFGLVDAARRERPVCAAVCRAFQAQEKPSLPRISVIVCTRDGSATLDACLASLGRLDYPDYEVLVVDDGSRQDIQEISQRHPFVRYHRQQPAGLSVARNMGARLASGSILAYTDDDCIAEPDWLKHLAGGFEDAMWAAVGGPNIPPAPRNRTEAIVAAAPGSPVHVLLDDTEAEHLPGCNLAIRKAALEAIGGFRPQYHAAGDDVDVCWRLREAGGRLRYVPGAMVWHHRRYQARAYLRQQAGYGAAEALLMRDYPERFGILGGARWAGGIYGDQGGADLTSARIFHGARGLGLFQGIYQQGPRCWADWLAGVAWVVLVVILLLAQMPLAALGVFGLSWLLALGRTRSLPPAPFRLTLREKMMRLCLCWLQPIVREGARLRGMVEHGAFPAAWPEWDGVWAAPTESRFTLPVCEQAFWSESGPLRERFLSELRAQAHAQHLPVRDDDGWQDYDLEINPGSYVSQRILTVEEYHGQGRCLLRVRLGWSAARLVWQVGGLFAALLLWSGYGIICAVLLLMAVVLQARARRHVRAVAARLGIQPSR